MPPDGDTADHCADNIAMDDVTASPTTLTVRETARVRAARDYLVAIVTSSVFIILIHLGHAIGLLYADHVLMVNSGMAYSPTIYMEAIPTYFMVFGVFVPFMFYPRWKSYILGEDPQPKDVEHFKPVIVLLAFIHSVSLHMLAYIAQVLVIVVQIYRRHKDRLPTGDRCSCYVTDLTYLVQTLSTAKAHQCACYLPSLPGHARSVQLITDDVSKLTHTALERYTGTTHPDPSPISVTQYPSEGKFLNAIARETFSEHYTTVIILVMCNLVIMATRLGLWIKVKQLWTESEKVHLAQQIAESTNSLRGDKKPSFKNIVKAACEVERILKRLNQKFEERGRSNVKMAMDEFTYSFLEGIDAMSLYLEMLQYAYVEPDSALLNPAIFFICLDLVVVNMVNALLAIPVHGERISCYTKASATIVTGIPFIIIRLFVYAHENRTGFPVLVLVLFLMKEIIGVTLSILDVIHMARYDCRRTVKVSS